AAELQRTHAARVQLEQHQRDLANHQYKQAWKKYGEEQDRIFEAATPEARDPKSPEYRKLQQAAADTLLDAGFTHEDIPAAWHGNVGLSLRSSAAQQILRDAARWRLSEERAKALNEQKVKPPPAQRPGMGTAPGAAAVHRADQALAHLKQSGTP